MINQVDVPVRGSVSEVVVERLCVSLIGGMFVIERKVRLYRTCLCHL